MLERASSEVSVLTSGESHFCGFHDLTPWNAWSDEIVCLRTSTDENRIPNHEDTAKVVVLQENGRTAQEVGSTRAWNWQKGARQRWLPSLGRRVVAFNAETSTGFECRIVDLDTGAERSLPRALYDISDAGGFGLSVDFSRLYRCQPGYGYDHPSEHPPLGYECDGIFKTDLGTGETRLLIRIEDVLARGKFDPNAGEHYFTHLQISPDGGRVAFIHRCRLRSGAVASQFVVASTLRSEFRVLLSDKMSHFDWKDSTHIVAWCRNNAAIRSLKDARWLGWARFLYAVSRRLRSRIIRQGLYGESFREIDVLTGVSSTVGRGVLTEDGHPQVNPCSPSVWVNDTYPNESDRQVLMIFDQIRNTRVDILSLPTQSSIRETCWRCDLHPRWHPGGSRVCVDSAHLGRRQVCVLDVGDYLPESVMRDH